MLRSLSKFSNWLWPLPPGAIGLGISGNRVAAVCVKRIGDGYCITRVATESLPFAPFRGTMPRIEDTMVLAQAIQRLAMAVPQGYFPLQIALPDPAAIFQVMEFDSLPETAHERAAIVRFRLEKEWPAVAQMECACQVLNKEEGHATLLALAIQRSWLDCLRDACRAAGLVPGVIDISAHHIFNRFHDAIGSGAGDGALISIEPDTWSILFWDRARCPRFIRNRWRDSEQGKDAGYEIIAQDVERLVRAYVLASPDRQIDRIYLCADEADRAYFTGRLNARMSVPCIHLDKTEGFSVSPEISILDISSGVLSAAIPRL